MSILQQVRFTLGLAIVATAAGAPMAFAQGNLSTQGFGYPTGQMSTRAQGTAGAVGELDPASPLNPAGIAGFGTRALVFQSEPEYRRVTAGGVEDNTTTARFPLLLGAFPVRPNWTVSLSASTFLDRTWATTSMQDQVVDADTVTVTTRHHVEGAINDLRLAGAWVPRSWLRVGLGVHALTGRNVIRMGQTFSDTVRFLPFDDARAITYAGSAISAGVQLVAPRRGVVGLSYRHGRTITATAGDTTVGSGSLPNRIGLSAAYLGFAGTTIALRTSREMWSSMTDFTGATAQGRDSWDTSVGADIQGPRVGGAGRHLMLRTGYRVRTLPFDAAGEPVTEHSVAGGLGTSFAGGRLAGDVGVIRAMRTPGGSLDVSERAWILSLGLVIRP